MTMRPKIPKEISHPYPIVVHDEVLTGYSRGSSELGIPTANINVTSALDTLAPGIYFGFLRVKPRAHKSPEFIKNQANQEVHFDYGASLKGQDLQTHEMVMSIGWNPFYNNTCKAAEVHIIHQFSGTFYGAGIDVVILGYLRPELNYTTKGM